MPTTSDSNKRRFFGTAAATVTAVPLGLRAVTERTAVATEIVQQAVGDSSAIRPFRASIPEADPADLRRRISATKWPEPETVTDDSQGVQLATIQSLARYWGTDYDWRKCEAKLNALPQFTTEIDGLDIHFIHAVSSPPEVDGTRISETHLL